MSRLTAIGTYLPTWGTDTVRVPGPDEDAVTFAVGAARAALRIPPDSAVDRVVIVTRDLPLLDGGNAAVLLAGVGLDDGAEVVEQVGGAPAVLDAVAGAAPGTLVLAADLEPAGAGAVLVGDDGPGVEPAGRVSRSLPLRSRARDGVVHDYDDPRLLRERGVGVAVERLGLPGKPDVVAGLPAKQAAALATGRPPALPTTGASAAVFALAAAPTGGLVLAVEQGSAAAVVVESPPRVHRDERTPQAPARLKETPGPDIAISLAAYERAFESKLRWQAGRCDVCGTLALPPRWRCLSCGAEGRWSYTPLPRSGAVYSQVTIHVPVPGLPTPYSLALVELDDVEVRALVKVTGVPAGAVDIDTRGAMVLRRVAVRSGVPDYGYALLPDSDTDTMEAAR